LPVGNTADEESKDAFLMGFDSWLREDD
jgi:hypothetical protein